MAQIKVFKCKLYATSLCADDRALSLFLFCHGMSTHLIFPPFDVLFLTLQMYIGTARYTLYCPGTSIFSIALVFMMALLCSCPHATDADDRSPHLIFPLFRCFIDLFCKIICNVQYCNKLASLKATLVQNYY